jgi:hypothetical protein
MNISGSAQPSWQRHPPAAAVGKMTQQQYRLGLRMVTMESGPFGHPKTEMANFLQKHGPKSSQNQGFPGFQEARLELCPHLCRLQNTAAMFFSTLHPLFACEKVTRVCADGRRPSAHCWPWTVTSCHSPESPERPEPMLSSWHPLLPLPANHELGSSNETSNMV